MLSPDDKQAFSKSAETYPLLLLSSFRYFGYFFAESVPLMYHVEDDGNANDKAEVKINIDGLTSKEYQEHLFDQAREEIELILPASDYQLFTSRFGVTRELAVRQCKQVVLELVKIGFTLYMKCLEKNN